MPDLPLHSELLLRQARGGDQGASERLLALYRERLRHMVVARMDGRMAARVDPSDVVQDALIEAARRMPDYLESEDQMFYPWLRKIAWERLIQLHRQHIAAEKRSVLRELPGGLRMPDRSATDLSRQLAAAIPTPSAVVVRRELQQRVQQRLQLLRSADQEVLLLRHVEQLPMDEVAAVLEVTLAAAQSRYRRALERLNELLGDDSVFRGPLT